MSYFGLLIGSRGDVNIDGWSFGGREVYLSFEFRSPF